jgi:uncharacterized membrane protein YbjE (DUF340 family)
MKFFIINSFRFIVYIAYFAIIALYAFGAYIQRGQVAGWVLELTGSQLQDSAGAAVSIVLGLIAGWFVATIVCGVLVTLLDIRDDINDRLPKAGGK